MWNPKWQPRNGCDGRLKAKISITTIQVNLGCLLHVSLWFGTELSLLKFLPLAYLHSHFLAPTLDFTSFFHNSIFGGCTLFYSWAVLDYILHVKLQCNINRPFELGSSKVFENIISNISCSISLRKKLSKILLICMKYSNTITKFLCLVHLLQSAVHTWWWFHFKVEWFLHIWKWWLNVTTGHLNTLLHTCNN